MERKEERTSRGDNISVLLKFPGRSHNPEGRLGGMHLNGAAHVKYKIVSY